jgi:drug/metabolite transporter (DMT)-like permease
VNNSTKSLVSLHIAVLLLGITALFSQLIPLNATDITFGRSVVAFIALTVVLKFQGQHLRLNSLKDYGIAMLLGVIMAIHWVSYFAAMQFAGVSVGMIALFTFPVITVLLEPLFEKITIALQDVASAIVVFAGICLIVPEISLSNNVTLGILIGVASAILYSLRNLIMRCHFSQYSGAQAMAYQTLVIVVSLFFFTSEKVFDASNNTYLLLFILGTICTAAPHSMVASSLRYLRAKTFSLIACIQPLYGIGLAVLLLDEQPNWKTLVGGAMIISAAIYETIRAHQSHK